ncbi:MAG: hypothetical protein AAFW98_09200 [Pseudomonadota bacterium]
MIEDQFLSFTARHDRYPAIEPRDALRGSARGKTSSSPSHGHLGAEECHLDADAGERLRRAFRRVFETHGQSPHYEMMSVVGRP